MYVLRTVIGLTVRMQPFGLFNRIHLDCDWQTKSTFLFIQLQNICTDKSQHPHHKTIYCGGWWVLGTYMQYKIDSKQTERRQTH